MLLKCRQFCIARCELEYSTKRWVSGDSYSASMSLKTAKEGKIIDKSFDRRDASTRGSALALLM